MDKLAKSKWLINIVLALALIPPAIYSFQVFHYALNLPRQDDYDAVLGFINQFKVSSFSERFSLLFVQHNEHRILFTKSFFAIYYLIFGTINFQVAILFNILLLLLIFSILVSFIKKAIPAYWHLPVLIMSICLFDLNGFENADFAMAGLQNYGIILFFMGSMYFYGKQEYKFLSLASLLQFICVFSSGNGNMASFFLVIFAWLGGKSRASKFTALATFLIAAPLYYFHYTRTANDFTLDYSKYIPWFLHTIAAHFGFDGGIVAGICILIFLFISFPYVKKYIIKDNTIQLVCIIGFILLSSAILAFFRGNLPLPCSVASRYMIYSNMLVAIVSTFLLLRIKKKKTQLIMSVLLFVGLGFMYIRNYRGGNEGFQSFYNAMHDHDYDYPFKDHAQKLTDESCRLGIYCIDKEHAKN